MKQSRLSKFLKPLPEGLRVFIIVIAYIVFFVAGIICFLYFTDIVYHIGLVMFGTRTVSGKGWETAIGLLIPLGFSFFTALSVMSWYCFEQDKKWVILTGLGAMIPISLVFAIVSTIKLEAYILLTEEYMQSYAVFFSTFLAIIWLMPFLLNTKEVMTAEIAKPVNNERSFNETES